MPSGFIKQKKGLLFAIPFSAFGRLLNGNFDLLGGLSTFNLECNSAFLLALDGDLASLQGYSGNLLRKLRYRNP